MISRKLFFFFSVIWICFLLSEGKLVQQEVDILNQMVSTMGSKDWKFDAETCNIEMVGMNSATNPNRNSSVECFCPNGLSDCHVVKIILKGLSLPGVLPPEMAKLPYLTYIDFAYNYLSGTIPSEWFSMKLDFISVLVNRLTGNIPTGIGNMTSLTYLNLEANQFSGSIPQELGNLASLETLILSSNFLTGDLPQSLTKLVNLKDFRLNDNNLNGSIPNFIQSWQNLTKLELHASGLYGPIPSTISLLSNLSVLKISDLKGPNQTFPNLGNMKSLFYLILRTCNLVGGIPGYLLTLDSLEMLDVSFNKLSGEIPPLTSGKRLRFIFLTGNLLTGNIPNSILITGSSVDFSYNNLTVNSGNLVCNKLQNLNINLYRGTNILNNTNDIYPCMNPDRCSRYESCLHVHTGGSDVSVNNTRYIGDGGEEGSTAKLFLDSRSEWGFSSTGDFVDDNNMENIRNVIQSNSPSLPRLYASARITPITLTYFHRCLENGKYTVTLHFAEIQYSNDATYLSLGRRIFDIYVQDKLVKKDFNIIDQVHRSETPFQLEIKDVDVSMNFLEVRLYFAGKGTTRIPKRGDYGPIISAISFVSDARSCSSSKGKKSVLLIVGLVVLFFFAFILVGALFLRHCIKKRKNNKEQGGSEELPSGTFSLKQIKAATNNFGPQNKIGEGGFGPVYKGVLADGTVVAVKQLSSQSRQGNREFLNEIGMISCLRHPNLVKLHGFCVEKDQLLLVYEYMENNSLARALFGNPSERLKLDWFKRHNIILGIARGLAFLHEESRLKIVHRDIKATNVLLDKNMTPKISDFGLARLDEEENSHISTRIAGTVGYMAPEYALWGYLTYKADVYSFGVVALEIVSGKNNNDSVPSDICFCLLDWAYHLNQNGNIMDIVDMTLGDELNLKEVEIMLKVAILCTSASPAQRPSMSEVVSMLEGKMAIPEVSEASIHSEDVRFKAMRGLELMKREQGNSSSQTNVSSTGNTTTTSLGLDRNLFNNESSSLE